MEAIKKSVMRLMFCLMPIITVFACSKEKPVDVPEQEWTEVTENPDAWDEIKRADITYQVLLYAYADADGDGYGDFSGLTDKLDYISAIGAKAIWLSPIHPSPSYHGYDVTDYNKLNPKLGTLADFNRLVEEAHKRGVKVYIDFVLNHTSTEHEWFKKAVASEENPFRHYYTFSKDPRADVLAGHLDMIASEGANGFVADEWIALPLQGQKVKGCYKFSLDWSDAKSPQLTVSKALSADAENTGAASADDKFLYFGQPAVNRRFYAKGGGQYELSVDFDSPWGFLVRTHSTEWGKHKYGTANKGEQARFGVLLTLKQEGYDVLLEGMDAWFYHSHFRTGAFADVDYGKVHQLSESKPFSEMVSAAKGWMAKGVDGFRLDAVKHIYHNASGMENPTFLQTFYNALDDYHKTLGRQGHVYMVGEVLSSAAEVAPYFSALPALFDFDFWNRLEWAINQGIGCYFVKDVTGYQKLYSAYRTDFIDATKLSNHDEDRTASCLGLSTLKQKLAAAVLLTAEGAPYIYYGEEVGLPGKKLSGDEYVRSAMPWGDKFTTSYTDKVDRAAWASVKPVKEQLMDQQSLLSHYIRWARARNTYEALAHGKMSRHPVYNELSTGAYKGISAWYMSAVDERMLVLHNFGQQPVELPLTDAIDRAVIVNGEVGRKGFGEGLTLRMGPCASVVFKLKR